MSVKKGFVFKNKPLRLTTGEFIGVTVDHVNNPQRRPSPDSKQDSYTCEYDNESLMYHDLCITKDENRAIICSYDGNFIETHDSNASAKGFAIDIDFMKYEIGTKAIIVNHETQGCRKGGGSRDFQIDGSNGKICFKPLVLGMREDETVDKKTKTKSSTLELVQYDSDRAFRVKKLKVGRSGEFNEPQLLKNQDGGFIGRTGSSKSGGWSRYSNPDGLHTVYFGDYRYMNLCLTTDKNKAITCTYDGQYISTVFPKTTNEPNYYKPFPSCCTVDESECECVFEFNDSNVRLGHPHTYIAGTQVRFANNECKRYENDGTRMPKAGYRRFQFFPDGQIGVKPLALGRAETGTKLVVVDPNSPKAVQLDLEYLLAADEASKPEINVKVDNKNKNYN